MSTETHPRPTFITRRHRPYFSNGDVELLSEKQRGKMSMNQEEKERQKSCSLMEAVGTRMGFPRKTIAAAQNLYHRLHLFYSRNHVQYPDAPLAALYVSTKMQDTLKKPRDILMVYYTVRSPELLAKWKSGVDLGIDETRIEEDRQRLLAVERLVLETICFNFTSRMPFPYVIKIGKQLKASKSLIKLSWRLAVDAQRSLVSLMYPPHEVAIASLYVGATLASNLPVATNEPTSMTVADGEEALSLRTSQEIAIILSKSGDWEERFHAFHQDVDQAGHAIIDMLIHVAQNAHSTHASPSTPTSPSSNVSSSHLRTQALMHNIAPPTPYSPDQLTQLKIAMREAKARAQNTPNQLHAQPRRHPMNGSEHPIDTSEEDGKPIGRNDGTIRFLFSPGATAA